MGIRRWIENLSKRHKLKSLKKQIKETITNNPTQNSYEFQVPRHDIDMLPDIKKEFTNKYLIASSFERYTSKSGPDLMILITRKNIN